MDKFIWLNPKIVIMSIVCGCVWVVMGVAATQVVIGILLVYFACLSLWNMGS